MPDSTRCTAFEIEPIIWFSSAVVSNCSTRAATAFADACAFCRPSVADACAFWSDSVIEEKLKFIATRGVSSAPRELAGAVAAGGQELGERASSSRAAASAEDANNSRARRGTVKLFNVNDGAVLRTFKHHTDVLYCLALLPDGLRFVSCSADKTARIVYHGLAPH